MPNFVKKGSDEPGASTLFEKLEPSYCNHTFEAQKVLDDDS